MGEDCGAWFSRHQLNMRLPTLDPLSAPFALGHECVLSTRAVTGGKVVSNDAGCCPLQAYKEVPASRIGQLDEAHGWFYCLPRFRQAFIPELNSSILKDGSLVAPSVDFDVNSRPWMSSGFVEKKFVVVDQSVGHTRIFYSLGIKSPNHSPNSLCVPHRINEEVERRKSDVNFVSGTSIAANIKDDHGDDVQSEMHEDTEELNALLYSDDDFDDSEEDEVDSTGHSPSMMMAQEREEYFGESTEAVASSAWPTKKRRLVDNLSGSPQNRYNDNEIEADSNANDRSSSSGEVNSTCRNKRLCKERISETVSLLEKLLPGTKGKDATVVLDEAIHYLNSLKDEARALGFSTM